MISNYVKERLDMMLDKDLWVIDWWAERIVSSGIDDKDWTTAAELFIVASEVLD